MDNIAGQDVIITVKEAIYIGTVTLSTNRYINVQAMEMKSSTMISTKFYKNELTSINALKTRHRIPTDDFTDFTLHELTRLSKMLTLNVFIERFDSVYHSAISEIASESYIGFYMPNIECGRFADSSIVAISTSKAIYLFDVQIMGRIETKIKTILEANVPKKIIHDASRVGDHLKHKHNINLSGVFDTMIANSLVGLKKSRASLGECLHDQLNLPETFLDQSTEDWQRRKLSSMQRQIAAQNVLFLKTLHFKLTRSALKLLIT